LKINSFLSHRFPHYPAHERAFGASENATFDAIYAIELLEHLIDPCELIKGISNKLRKGGVFICTTIKNVPQYDHLYNFTNADVFEREVKDYGFHLERRIVLPHHSAFTQLEMNNIFYIFRKS
jgi:2-polyprenyl-3-methyl-5-hydroxy-6-metoxy-1,4-benzoquinol methylase